MRRNLRKWAGLVLVAAIVLFAPKHLHAATCIEQYETAAMENWSAWTQCWWTAQDYAWYDPRKSAMVIWCAFEFDSNAIENAAKYTRCMAIDVFFKA
jgi:hypothetical protein